MKSTFNWKPEKSLLQKLTDFARQTGQSPEIIVTEAVKLYLEHSEKQTVEEITLSERDWNIVTSALENPPEANQALKAAIKQHQEKYGQW